MIRIENVRYAYPGADKFAVDGLSCVVESGEIFGFLGPSGAGKSTTQKILTGLLKGWHGSVSVFGKDLSDIGRSYYERIGVSFEFPNLYGKLSAFENLEFFASLYRRRGRSAMELLESVGLEESAGRRVSEFSKGMKMRLNVCRALVNAPELLFLDEPTSGQDPVSAKKVKDLIAAEKAAGKTVFLTTHNMALAQEICDRVAFIVDGKIRLVDSPRDLMVRYGARSVLVETKLADGEVASRRFPLDGLGDDAAFIDTIRTGKVERMHTEEASLEDIFIRATGRSLE